MEIGTKQTALSVVVSGLMGVLAALFVGKLGQFVFSVLLGRYLGPTTLGVYATTIALFGVCTTIASLGMSPAIFRFVSKAASVSETRAVKGMLLRALEIVIPSCLVVGLFLWMARDFLSVTILGEERIGALLWLAPFAIVNTNVAVIFYEAARALRWITSATFFYIATPPLILISIFVSLAGDASTATPAVLAFAVAPVAAIFGLGWWLFQLKQPVREGQHGLAPTHRQLIGVSIPLLIPSVVGSLFLWSNYLMLQALGSTTDVGIFHAVWKLTILIFLPVQALSIVLTPTLVRYLDLRQQDRLRRSMRVACDITCIVSVGQLALVILGGSWLLSLYGNEFVVGMPALVLIGLAQTAFTMTVISRELLLARGDGRVLSREVLIAVSMDMVLKFVLIPIFGVVGIGLSNIVSQCYLAGRLIGVATRRFEMTIVPTNLVATLTVTVMTVTVCLIVQSYTFQWSGIALFPFIFVPLVWKFSLESEGRRIISRVVHSAGTPT